MPTVKKIIQPHQVSIQTLGSITLPVDSQTPVFRHYVYQRVAKWSGNIKPGFQLRIQGPQNHPNSEEQLQCRRRFKAAVHAWQALSELERQSYRVRARKLHCSGYNLFIREFSRQHSVEEFAESWIQEVVTADASRMVSPLTVRKAYIDGAW